MALAITITKRGRAGRSFKVFGTLVPSGSYATGGDALDLSSYNPTQSGKQPDFVDIQGKAGFVYQYDAAAKKMMVYTNTAGGANNPLGEHTAAAYAAGVASDTITFEATWLA